jgi:hypothetical protein
MEKIGIGIKNIINLKGDIIEILGQKEDIS